MQFREMPVGLTDVRCCAIEPEKVARTESGKLIRHIIVMIAILALAASPCAWDSDPRSHVGRFQPVR